MEVVCCFIAKRDCKMEKFCNLNKKRNLLYQAGKSDLVRFYLK